MLLRPATHFALGLALCAWSCSSPTAPSRTSLLPVDEVEVLIAESQPPQVSVRVKGTVNPCTVVGAISQSRQGNLITVTITTRSTADVCIQLAVSVEENIRLDGSFPPGTYRVRVNGVERTFRV